LQEFVERADFVPMVLVSLACQINKTHGDPEMDRTSVSECIKGATIRLPPSRPIQSQTPAQVARSRRETFGTTRENRERSSPFMDQKSGRLLGFGVNLITFLILGYFLGGFALNPILGLPSCEGLTPCVGSVIGLFISGMGSLAYTYYYFVKKM
jgi:hypothetical protein